VRPPYEVDPLAALERARSTFRAAKTSEQEMFSQVCRLENSCVVGLGHALVTFVLFVRVILLCAVGLGLERAKFGLVIRVQAPFEAYHDHVWEKRLSVKGHPFRS